MQKRLNSFLVLALLFAGIANANELPDMPKPKVQTAPKPVLERRFDKHIFVLGEILLAASKTADAITTRRVLDSGGYENDGVFGRHPSPAKQAGVNLLFFAGETGIFYLTEHSKHSILRWSGRAFLGYTVTGHAIEAVCNSRINTHSLTTQNCPVF